ncbi:MAG: glycosyltransferase family 2 protein [Verrucomicrobiota bacterium]|nr:glycosyltransferase family 2 protein [Verrucomicrobiota bacterium]
MDLAVAVIVFNRPRHAARLLATLEQVKPNKLFVIADGPREGGADDAKCAEVRALFDRVPWDCQVFRNYSEKNLGCGPRPATGISWVFEHVDEAIILEDDCVPDLTFFPYCQELLKRYRDDNRIMQISGNNFQFGSRSFPSSYYFSNFFHCWGWATWKRAWTHFSHEMTDWNNLDKDVFLRSIINDPAFVKSWKKTFDYAASAGRNHIWDYPWLYSCWRQKALCVLPAHNLVSNRGFDDEGGTHTHGKSRYMDMVIAPLEFPLKHPDRKVADIPSDNYTQKTMFNNTLRYRLKRRLYMMLGKEL